jgi:class 3 adenylate cyclase
VDFVNPIDFQRKSLPISTAPGVEPHAGRQGDLLSGTITFLFTDIEGSTKLWEQHPEGMKAALARHDALLSEVIAAHDGRVVKTLGDGIHAAFDAAGKGVAAALAAQRALLADVWEEIKPQVVRVRMALHTCEAEARVGDYYGPGLNRAARLMSIFDGGQTLLSAITADLVRNQLPMGASLRDLGEHRLKDLVRSEHVYQLAHPDLPAAFPPVRSLNAFRNNLPVQLTSFIGRQAEVEGVKISFCERMCS